MAQPNIVVIMTDQQRLDSIGAYGGRQDCTPHINRLAAQGMVFEGHYATSALCLPARCSLATGRHAHANGALINGFQATATNPPNVLGPQEQTVFEVLANAGYRMAHVGVNHVRTEPPLTERVAFDRFISNADYDAYLQEQGLDPVDMSRQRATIVEKTREGDVIRNFSAPWPGRHPHQPEDTLDAYWARQAVDFLQTAADDQPFALFCLFWAPHPPFVVPEPYATMFSPDDIDLPPNILATPELRYHLSQAVVAQHGGLDNWRQTWAAYLGLVRLVDDCVGQVLAALDARADRDNTVVLFASDHGEMLGAHSLFQKMCLYQESIHVPLIVRAPGGTSGRWRGLSSHVDILPTLLDYAGIAFPPHVHGASLRPAVEGVIAPERAAVFSEYNGDVGISYPQRAVITEQFKLIHYEDGARELYDLHADPYEQRNLAGSTQVASIEEELCRRLAQWMNETGDWVLAPPVVT